MDFSAWSLYLFLASLALVAVALHYRAREPAGRGRGLLILLRGLALAILLLLLFDPVLPTKADRGRETAILLDASLSMRLAGAGDESRWSRAVRLVEDERNGGIPDVFLVGDAAVEVRPDPGSLEPREVSSRLEPAVRAALESGARDLRVITDGGLEDAQQARALVRGAGGSVEFISVDVTGARNLAVAELEVPSWLESGEEATARVAVAALGAAGDSVTVVLRSPSGELARASVAAPDPGRLAMAELPFTMEAEGLIRLEATLDENDQEPDDDARFAYVRVTEEPAGVALLSLRPDQEPRFLLPVLERALGVPVRGWLALPGGRYIRLGAGADAGVAAGESAVRAAMADADLLVLHGVDAAAPAWVREHVEAAGRLLVFPGSGVLDELPLELGESRTGDWYPDAEVPSSPLAPLLSGVQPGDAPPLTSVRGAAEAAQADGSWWSPLNVRLGRRGETAPAILVGDIGGRRLALAMGVGYWRWAFSEGEGRQLYRRLWSAVGGWLMEEAAPVAGSAVEPDRRVVPRGAPVLFRLPPGVDSLRLRIVRSDLAAPDADVEGTAVRDTVLPVREGLASSGVLEPGHYRVEAGVPGEGEAGTVTERGPLTVEWYSPEFTRPAAGLADVERNGATGSEAGGASGRPLRTRAWPYLLLVTLLCVEWVLRRRWGLR